MTYLQFHVFFNAPVLLLLLLLTRRRLTAVHFRWIAVICGIVLLVTTPWDNWAVYQGIWGFDWNRVTPVAATIGGVRWRLPAEEYGFFILETIMVSLITILFLPGARPGR